MSLIAASLTKSSVFGVMPSAELTPVFSPADCAKTAVEARRRPAARAKVAACIGRAPKEMFLVNLLSKPFVPSTAIRRLETAHNVLGADSADRSSGWSTGRGQEHFRPHPQSCPLA